MSGTAVARREIQAPDGEVVGQIVTHQPPAMDFGGLLQLCKELVPTGFLPQHIKTPGQAAAIILAGRELGMEPMLALRSITMVQGKIVVAADAQLALFKARGGRATFVKLTDTDAMLELTHPNGDEHTETFTMKDATQAGLTGNSTWKKFPKAMLRSRCITAGLKSIGFEPTSGAYDPDEAQHFAPAVVVETESGTAPSSESSGSESVATPTPKPEPAAPATKQFGPDKGTPLSQISDTSLEKAIIWAKSHAAERFAEAIKEMERELDSRGPIDDNGTPESGFPIDPGEQP